MLPFSQDTQFMTLAVRYAERGLGHTRPNPPVGALVVNDADEILGKGYHRRAGEDHAEVAAIKDAVQKGHSVAGCTLYVTLEPCSRPGRVGACTEAIVAAKIARVIYGAADPNPVNHGKAEAVLARAGIACRQAKDEARLMCEKLIAPFAKRVQTGLPFVTVKLAMSLDGKICDDWGAARWISSESSRRETNDLRLRNDAIMVGAETIRKDNPSLLSHTRQNDDLVRVVVSKSGKLPKDAQVFTDGKNETLVFADARQALEELGRRGFNNVLCEGGLKLARSLAEAGLVDRWISVVAPVVIGAKPLAKALRGKMWVQVSANDDGFLTTEFARS